MLPKELRVLEISERKRPKSTSCKKKGEQLQSSVEFCQSKLQLPRYCHGAPSYSCMVVQYIVSSTGDVLHHFGPNGSYKYMHDVLDRLLRERTEL
jgi:hypothetical protein